MTLNGVVGVILRYFMEIGRAAANYGTLFPVRPVCLRQNVSLMNATLCIVCCIVTFYLLFTNSMSQCSKYLVCETVSFNVLLYLRFVQYTV